MNLVRYESGCTKPLNCADFWHTLIYLFSSGRESDSEMTCAGAYSVRKIQ